MKTGWMPVDTHPLRCAVYECYRQVTPETHCTEWLRWTGDNWITNDKHGYPRTDVVSWWNDATDENGWSSFRVIPSGKIYQRKVLYWCNPELAIDCLKTGCKYTTRDGMCDATKYEECAMRTPGGLPLVKEMLIRLKPEPPEEVNVDAP